jgi:hypothetical protein
MTLAAIPISKGEQPPQLPVDESPPPLSDSRYLLTVDAQKPDTRSGIAS